MPFAEKESARLLFVASHLYLQAVEGLFLLYYKIPDPRSEERLKGSSVEGRKEGRRTERGNY